MLRDTGATATIGGGMVLDPFPPRRGRRTGGRLAQLRALEDDNPLDALLAVQPGWTDAGLFVRARTIAGLNDLPAPVGGLFIAAAALAAIRESVVATLARYHKAHPELPGLQPDRLRAMLSPQAEPERSRGGSVRAGTEVGILTARPPVTAFAGILDAFVRDGYLAREGPWFRLPDHRAGLSPMDEKIWPIIAPLLGEHRFRPPRVNELAVTLKLPEAAIRASLKRLSRLGLTTEVVTDLFFLRQAVAEMAAIAADTRDENGDLTAAGFRDRLNNGRKVAIHVLEFFDKVGITVRSGDLRRVRPEKAGLFGSADV